MGSPTSRRRGDVTVVVESLAMKSGGRKNRSCVDGLVCSHATAVLCAVSLAVGLALWTLYVQRGFDHFDALGVEATSRVKAPLKHFTKGILLTTATFISTVVAINLGAVLVGHFCSRKRPGYHYGPRKGSRVSLAVTRTFTCWLMLCWITLVVTWTVALVFLGWALERTAEASQPGNGDATAYMENMTVAAAGAGIMWVAGSFLLLWSCTHHTQAGMLWEDHRLKNVEGTSWGTVPRSRRQELRAGGSGGECGKGCSEHWSTGCAQGSRAPSPPSPVDHLSGTLEPAHSQQLKSLDEKSASRHGSVRPKTREPSLSSPMAPFPCISSSSNVINPHHHHHRASSIAASTSSNITGEPFVPTMTRTVSDASDYQKSLLTGGSQISEMNHPLGASSSLKALYVPSSSFNAHTFSFSHAIDIDVDYTKGKRRR